MEVLARKTVAKKLQLIPIIGMLFEVRMAIVPPNLKANICKIGCITGCRKVYLCSSLVSFHICWPQNRSDYACKLRLPVSLRVCNYTRTATSEPWVFFIYKVLRVKIYILPDSSTMSSDILLIPSPLIRIYLANIIRALDENE